MYKPVEKHVRNPQIHSAVLQHCEVFVRQHLVNELHSFLTSLWS